MNFDFKMLCISIFPIISTETFTILIDRPFERKITLQKDSAGHVGFIFKNAKITSIVKDSSAAR